MATEVYGEPGNSSKSPPFQLTGVGGNLSVTVNKQTGVTQVYRANALNTQQSLGTYDPKTKKFTADSTANLTAAEKSSLSSTTGTQAITTAGTQTAQKGGATNASSLLNPTSAPNNNTGNTGDGTGQQGGLNQQQSQALGQENDYKDGTRTSYGDDLKYPLNLKSELQDVIRFSILEYSPSLAKENQSQGGTGSFGSTKKRVVTLDSGIPIISGSKRIGGITLPVPSGISDGNTVSWQDDTLNQLQAEAAKLANSYFTGGVEAAKDQAGQSAEALAAATKAGDAQTAVKSLFGSAATAGGNVAGRAYGAAFNNNLELLFSSPGLRTFSFQFSFYPRGKDEAIMVRRIIRAFKQSMSVKRSKTSLLLKAPHTFAISYVTAGGKAHPYLNRFKECALTSCSVDYTPDGTYMTYGGEEKSMTAYRMTLQFQELEPLFDDEYGQDDSNVGF
jgi:hypothetical protein